MTRAEFEAAAKADGIRPDAWCLDGTGNECYALEAAGTLWRVFYSERGLQTDVRTFPTESAALDDLLARLHGDRSAHTIG